MKWKCQIQKGKVNVNCAAHWANSPSTDEKCMLVRLGRQQQRLHKLFTFSWNPLGSRLKIYFRISDEAIKRMRYNAMGWDSEAGGLKSIVRSKIAASIHFSKALTLFE